MSCCKAKYSTIYNPSHCSCIINLSEYNNNRASARDGGLPGSPGEWDQTGFALARVTIIEIFLGQKGKKAAVIPAVYSQNAG
jgi:hypothetical protein